MNAPAGSVGIVAELAAVARWGCGRTVGGLTVTLASTTMGTTVGSIIMGVMSMLGAAVVVLFSTDGNNSLGVDLMVIVHRESAAIADSEVGAVTDLVGRGEPTGVA